MKKKIFLLTTVIFWGLNACMTTMVPLTDVSVYEHIPLAPNVVLTVETPVVAAPGPNYVWIDGYWTWDYGYREYVWVPGHWELTPYTGAYWIPGYWDYYGGGYRWIDAGWLPRNTAIKYGYSSGRYDYYGRPVYYQKPGGASAPGYAFVYDHRPQFRSKSYSSSPGLNDTPKTERTRITQEYRKEASTTSTPASRPSTNRNTQGSIRVRTDESQPVKRETTPARSSSSSSNEKARQSNSTNSRSGNARSSSGSTSGSTSGRRQQK